MSHVLSALLKILSLGARFHTVLSLSVKGGKARWHLNLTSAFPSPLCQSVLFPYRWLLPLEHWHGAHTHTLFLSAHWQRCPYSLPSCARLVDQTVTSRPLNDILLGCGVTHGPIKNQTPALDLSYTLLWRAVVHNTVTTPLTGCQHLCQDDQLSGRTPKPSLLLSPPSFMLINTGQQSFIFPCTQTAGLFLWWQFFFLHVLKLIAWLIH